MQSPPPAKRRKALIIESEDEEEAGNNTERDEGSEETYHSDEDLDTDDSELTMDEAHSDIITEMQQMAPLAEEDNDELKPSSTWNEHYTQGEPKNDRDHFMSKFYHYLLHVEEGAHSKEQALIHVRQVHTVLEVIKPNGEDIACLMQHRCMDIWDVFAAPCR